MIETLIGIGICLTIIGAIMTALAFVFLHSKWSLHFIAVGLVLFAGPLLIAMFAFGISLIL